MTPLMDSAIEAWARAHGARLGEAAGWRVAEGYGALEAELDAVRTRVALVDLSALGKVQVEGEAAPGVISAALGGAPGGVGGGWHGEKGEVYCIRPDLFLVLTPPGGEAEAVARLEAARANAAGLVTVTDMTHGLAAIGLIGPSSRDLLRRLCALDVGPEAFPNEAARATSVAKTRQVIVRRDLGGTLAYTLAGSRSLAEYVWEALAEGGKAFGGAPIGAAAMVALAAGTEARD